MKIEQDRERIAKEVYNLIGDNSVQHQVQSWAYRIADWHLAEIEKAKKEAHREVAERIKGACPYDLNCEDGSEQPCSCAKECDKIIKENEVKEEH